MVITSTTFIFSSVALATVYNHINENNHTANSSATGESPAKNVYSDVALATSKNKASFNSVEWGGDSFLAQVEFMLSKGSNNRSKTVWINSEDLTTTHYLDHSLVDSKKLYIQELSITFTLVISKMGDVVNVDLSEAHSFKVQTTNIVDGAAAAQHPEPPWLVSWNLVALFNT